MVSDLLFVSGFLLVATSKKNPEFVAQSSKGRCRRRIFQQLHVEVRAELLGVNPRLKCGTDDAIRGLDSQVVWYSFPVERQRTSPLLRKEVPLWTAVNILSFKFLFASSIGEKPLKIFVLCTSAKSSFYLVELVVEFPRFVSCLLLLALCPIVTQLLQIDYVLISSVPRTFLCSVTTGVRILEISSFVTWADLWPSFRVQLPCSA